MKRTAESNEVNSSKRLKVSVSDPFDPALKKKVFELCENGSDGSGHISGTVFMTWPVKQKVRFNVETVENGRKYRFDVELSGACSRHFNKLGVHSQDSLQIALKGVLIEKTKDSSSPNSLPMALKYHDGVIIKFVRRCRKPSENGLIVDTWLRKYAFSYFNSGRTRDVHDKCILEDVQAQHLPEDEWFYTPVDTPRDSFVSPKGDKVCPVVPRPQSHDALPHSNLPSAIPSSTSELSASNHQSAPESSKSKPSEPPPSNGSPPRDVIVLGAESDKPSDKRPSVIAPSAEAMSRRQYSDAAKSTDTQPVVSVLTRKQEKKLRKARLKEQRVQQAALAASTSATSSGHHLAENVIPNAGKEILSENNSSMALHGGVGSSALSNTNTMESTSATLSAPLSGLIITQNNADPALNMKAGCRNENVNSTFDFIIVTFP
jgi:hypothetical protein